VTAALSALASSLVLAWNDTISVLVLAISWLHCAFAPTAPADEDTPEVAPEEPLKWLVINAVLCDRRWTPKVEN